MLDSCCISIGLLFIKDKPVSSFGCVVFDLGCFVFEFWVLRLRDLGASCFGFRFRVLRFRNYLFLFRKLSTWPVFGCLGPAPYWLIEAAFEPSTTTLSSKLIFLCQYRLKEQSLFIVFLETTSKLITFSQRSIKLLVGILFEFFTSAKSTEF